MSAPASSGVLSGRRGSWAFWIGCVAVTAGVLLHLPMVWMARDMGYRLAGMPMDAGMLAGMFLIVGGVAVSGYGLLPRRDREAAAQAAHIRVTPPEDAPLTGAHWALMATLVVALVIDTMKPASLGFVTPGMLSEYGLPKAIIAYLPFTALAGTVTGSIVWGVLADLYGRRASILLSAVMFVGTSICGAMPDFWWNVVMCFLMGAAAGGMLPVAYALLAEAMPSKHRGWSLVLIGGLGAVGGYLAASGLSAALQPTFGWRVMWFLGLPTGLLLILLNGAIPESAKFLMALGRADEARTVMRRFGARIVEGGEDDDEADADAGLTHGRAPTPPIAPAYLAKTLALSITAIVWGLVNFGILLWLPQDLTAKGYSMGALSQVLALSALIATPTVFLCAFLYSRWSTKWSLIAMLAVMGVGLALVLQLEAGGSGLGPVVPVALLIVGSNGVLSILLPYTAENYPVLVRGRATGWVAACSKFGGLIAQALAIAAAAPAVGVAAGLVMIPAVLAMAMVARFGAETRGRDLRELEREPPAAKAAEAAP